MPTFNRERAKAELGWDDAQIDAYLSSSQGRQDSVAAVSAGPTPPLPSGGSDPLGQAAGMASAAVDAIGGPRTLLYGAGGGAGAYVLKKAMQHARGGATPPTPPNTPPHTGPPMGGPPPNVSRGTSAPKVSASLHTLTEDDIKNVPAFKGAKPGEVVRRSFYENERYAKPATPAKRTQAKIVPLPKRRTTKPPAPLPERVPIEVQERPGATRGKPQRGLSKRQMTERQGAAAKVKPAPSAAVSAMDDDLMSQLARSEQAAIGMRGAGDAPVRAKLFSGIKSGAIRNVPGALGMLMTLLDAQSMPQQMDEAGREVRRAINPRLADLIGDDYFENARKIY